MPRLELQQGQLKPVDKTNLKAGFDPSDPHSDSFNIEDPDPNIEDVSITLFKTAIPRLLVLFFSDIHYGNPACDTELVEGYIKWAEGRDDVVVVGNGDWMENVTRDSKGDIFEQNINPQRQIDWLTASFEKLASQGKLLAVRDGNHELRTYNATGIDPMKIIAGRLGIKYLQPTSYHIFKVGSQEYTMVSQHGSGGANALAGKINKIKKMTESHDADVYVQGHSHHAFAAPLPYIGIYEEELQNRTRWLVNSGHFLNYFGTYADVAGYVPGKRGCPKIKLYSDKRNIHVSI